jgi:hypothetical protein
MIIRLFTSILNPIKTFLGVDSAQNALDEIANLDQVYGVCCDTITRKLKDVPLEKIKSLIKVNDAAATYELGCRYIDGEGVSRLPPPVINGPLFSA